MNIVVLQADGRRFGLVVEGINDTEEIVVKPLGKQLKGVALFAGATIMGDGRVSLILDVAGIAQRAGLVSAVTKRLALDESKGQQSRRSSSPHSSCCGTEPTAGWPFPCRWWPASRRFPARRSSIQAVTKWSSTATRSFRW